MVRNIKKKEISARYENHLRTIGHYFMIPIFFMSAGVFYKARHTIHHMLIKPIHHSYSYDAPQVIESKPARNLQHPNALLY